MIFCLSGRRQNTISVARVLEALGERDTGIIATSILVCTIGVIEKGSPHPSQHIKRYGTWFASRLRACLRFQTGSQGSLFPDALLESAIFACFPPLAKAFDFTLCFNHLATHMAWAIHTEIRWCYISPGSFKENRIGETRLGRRRIPFLIPIGPISLRRIPGTNASNVSEPTKTRIHIFLQSSTKCLCLWRMPAFRHINLYSTLSSH